MQPRILALAVLVSIIAAAGCQSRDGAPTARPKAGRVVAAAVAEPARPSEPQPMTAAPPMPKRVPLRISRRARTMLRQNGFVVLGRDEHWSILDYGEMNAFFITSDAVLYVFHQLLGASLVEYEKDELLPLVRELVDRCLDAARQQHEKLSDDPLLAEPARRCVVFFAVADALLRDGRPVAEAAEAGEYVRKIKEAREIEVYPGEDWTLYRPRGAYADDPELAAYFRAMKWLSRRIWPIIPGGADREPEASIKLRQAWLIGRMLDEDETARELWEKVYGKITLLVGRPDSFTPLEFARAVRQFGDRPDDQWISRVREDFSRPKYAGSVIAGVRQANPGDAPAKYVQFLGERYIPDGEVLQRVCFPYTRRTVPEGLDVAFALFGIDRAHEHLVAEGKTSEQCERQWKELREKLATYGTVEQPASVYAGWVGAVRELAAVRPSQCAPPFMLSDAWKDKTLNTALASWAYMRHTFVLHAKQPTIPMGVTTNLFVEPVPEFYRRLAAVARLADTLGFAGMSELALLCDDLARVADLEMQGKPPRDAGALTMRVTGFYVWLLENFQAHVAEEKPCVVVDVATDTNTGSVVHAATGPLNPIVVYAPTPHSREKWGFYPGLALSYYEFVEHDRRLTDAEWLKRVKAGKHHACRPWWAASFLADVKVPSPPKSARVGGRSSLASKADRGR